MLDDAGAARLWADVFTRSRPASQDASSRIGREETLGGGSAFEPREAGGFETVREGATTTTRELDDFEVTCGEYEVAGGEYEVTGPPLVVAI